MITEKLIELEAAIDLDHPLANSRLKLVRAFHHIEELRSIFCNYLAGNPITVSGITDHSSGDYLYVLEKYQKIDPYVSTVIGDVFHNMRAALDYVASALVVSNGGVINHKTHFPICASAERFRQASVSGLAGASSKAVAAVEALQPYKNEKNFNMTLIQNLNNFDKHRIIVPVIAGTKSVDFNISGTFSEFIGEEVDFGWLQLKPADRQLPLNVGDVVFAIAKAARESSKNHKYRISVELVFGDVTEAYGKDIGTVIDACMEHSISAVEYISKEIF